MDGSIDLAAYDKKTRENTNVLHESLRLFKAMSRSILGSRPMLLVLMNMGVLEKQLRKSPFNVHFPEYRGQNNATAIGQYILKRCKRTLNNDQEIFSHFANDDAEDVTTIDFFSKYASGLPSLAIMTKILGLQTTSVHRNTDGTHAVFRKRLLSTHTI
jgi:hypothetical protein